MQLVTILFEVLRVLNVHHIGTAVAGKLLVCTAFILAGTGSVSAVDEELPKPASLKGEVTLEMKGLRLADLGPFVVFLESVDPKFKYELPKVVPKVRQKDARFSPAFLVVAAGQTVEMPNDDTIFHNAFSYSKPNDFDLGIYPKGTSRSVTFRHPGLVRIYCSIHASMNGRILVAPSPYFDTVGKTGAFELGGVRPGKYLLRTWNQKLPEHAQYVELSEGKELSIGISIGERDSPKKKAPAEQQGEAGSRNQSS